MSKGLSNVSLTEVLPGQSRGVGGADMPRQLRLADLHPGHHAQVAQVGGQRLQPETMQWCHQQVALSYILLLK